MAQFRVTHSEYVTFIAFHSNSRYANAPQYHVMGKLDFLFSVEKEGRGEKGSGENYIMRSLLISTPHPILFGL